MKIKEMPDSSKPRERFIKFGAEALSDEELMAIIMPKYQNLHLGN